MSTQRSNVNLQASTIPATSSKRSVSEMTGSGDTASQKKRPGQKPGQENVSFSNIQP